MSFKKWANDGELHLFWVIYFVSQTLDKTYLLTKDFFPQPEQPLATNISVKINTTMTQLEELAASANGHSDTDPDY